MSTTNSQLIQHINSKNISAAAKNSQVAAHAAKISAEASLANAEATFQVLRENLKQTDILNKSLFVAIQNNEFLKEINAQLREVGKSMDDLSKAVERQTQLHREHYDEVRKEKALKEVLYNIKKYFKSLESVKDAVSRAYGAKTLLNFLSAGDLKTKDLSDIKDKEYYDEQLEAAEKSMESLSEDEKKDLEAFEKIYSCYMALKEADLRKEFPDYKSSNSFYQADYKEIEDARPQIPMEIKHFTPSDWHTIELIRKYKLISTSSGFASLGMLVITGKWLPKDSGWEQLGSVLVVAFMASWLYLKYKIYITKTENLKKYSFKDYKLLEEMHKDFRERLSRYETQKDASKNLLDEDVREMNSRVEKENQEIQKFNEEIDLELREAEENRKKILESMKNDINSFLEKHSKIQEFLPKVG